MPAKINILIVDDEALLRQGARQMKNLARRKYLMETGQIIQRVCPDLCGDQDTQAIDRTRIQFLDERMKSGTRGLSPGSEVVKGCTWSGTTDQYKKRACEKFHARSNPAVSTKPLKIEWR